MFLGFKCVVGVRFSEVEGADVAARAKQINDALPQFPSNHPLTSMIELPI